MAIPVYIEQTVAARLKASAEVAALAADRVYPRKAPPGAALPAVTYQRTDSSPNYTLGGYGSETVTLALNSLAATYEDAKALAIAVRHVMTAAPISATVKKEADLLLDPDDEHSEDPCVSTEYLVQQSGGYDHG